jgi:hypothetical protein
MSCAIINSDELLLHHIQLLQAVRVLRVCDITYMLKDLSCIDWLPPIYISSYLLQLRQQQQGDRLAWTYRCMSRTTRAGS